MSIGLTRFDVATYLEEQRCKPGFQKITFDFAKNHVVNRAAHTEFEPVANRIDYSKNPEMHARCSNQKCMVTISGSDDYWHCDACGFEAYCSITCQKADEKSHLALSCKGSLTFAIRQIYPFLEGAVTHYYNPHTAVIQKLADNEWLDPLSTISDEHVKAYDGLLEKAAWIGCNVARSLLSAIDDDDDDDDGAQPGAPFCFTCGKSLPRRIMVLADAKFNIMEIINDTDDDEPDETRTPLTLEELGDMLAIRFTGIDKGGVVVGYMTLCCDKTCSERHSCITNRYNQFLFLTNPLNGNTIIRQRLI